MDREATITELGALLAYAVKVSITQGATWDPGELISNNASGIWRQVAEVLVALAEEKQGGGRDVQRT